jgi:hypothetical protein
MVASLDAQLEAVLLPAGFHVHSCGRLCTGLEPEPPGSLSVAWITVPGSAGHDEPRREVGVFGALRVDEHRWLVAVVTADERWFHGEYTDARLLRQRGGDPPEPLRSVLTAELIILQ